MNRPAKTNEPAPNANALQNKLSRLVLAMVGAVLASCVLITGDSISVSSGETLPQVLLILGTVLVAAGAGWNLLPFGSGRYWATSLFVVGVSWLLLSTVTATFRADGRAAWNSFWHIISLLLFAMLMSQVAQRAAIARALVQLILVVCVFQATFALYQYFVSMPAARAEYLADPDAALMKAELQAPPGSEIRMQYESRLLGSFEPLGTFALTNSLAALLSGLIVALGSIIWFNKPSANELAIWTARASWLMIAVVWLLTKSRSGWLAVFVVAGVFIIWQRFAKQVSPETSAVAEEVPFASSRSKLKWFVAACLALLLIGSAIVGLSSDQLVLSEAPKSIQYRLEYWQATSKMILDYPLTGVGFGNFQSYYAAYKLPVASEAIADPHNWMFDLAANCSVPLLITAVLALSLVIRRALFKVAQANNAVPIEADATDKSLLKALWLGVLLAFIGIAALQLLFGELIDVDATFIAFVAAGLCWGLQRRLPMTLRAVRRAALLALVTTLLCLLSSGSWQASGIAIPLATWIGICCPGDQDVQPWAWRQRSSSSLTALGLVTLALAGFIWQTWQPVQISWSLEQQAISAWQRGEQDTAVALVRQAIATDSLAPSPRRLSVQLSMDQAMTVARKAQPDLYMAAVERVDAGLKDLIAHDPISNLNYSYAGECNLALGSGCATWSPEFSAQRVEEATRFYEQAVERYPTSVALIAQLGTLHAWQDMSKDGRISQATAALLAKAESLSQITPHTNRKLASQQLYLPAPLSDRFPPETIVRPTSESPWVQAEPLCDFLRKL